MSRILVVDDEIANREFMRLILSRAGYRVDVVIDGITALESVEQTLPDLIVMDVVMPGLDGIEVCRQLKANPRTNRTLVLFVTALGDRRTRVDAFRAGGSDFISKPFDRVEFLLRVENLIAVKNYFDLMQNQKNSLEHKVSDATNELRKAYKRLNDAYVETVNKLTVAAEFRDEETGQHIRRIGYYAKSIATEMGLTPDFCEKIFYAAPMHDIGKIAIPDSILLKPSQLTNSEFHQMKDHTVIGWKLLSGSKSDMLNMGANIALNHHERFDGTGYPNGAKAQDIPMEGRIVMTVDVYDALRSKRPYKPAFDHRTAMDIVLKGDARLPRSSFDPDILAVMDRISGQVADIFEQLKEPET